MKRKAGIGVMKKTEAILAIILAVLLSHIVTVKMYSTYAVPMVQNGIVVTEIVNLWAWEK